MPLHLHVDTRSGYPVYLQIVEQVRRAVAVGVLVLGEQLPSVKQISSDLVINPATVSRSLRELEHLGIVESLPGRGAFVRVDATPAVAASAAGDVVRGQLEAAVREAHTLGVAATEVRKLFIDAIDASYSNNGKSEDP